MVERFKELTPFKPEDGPDTAEAADKWLKTRKLEIVEKLGRVINFPRAFLGRRIILGLCLHKNYTRDLMVKSEGFSLRLNHWPNGITEVAVAPTSGQEAFKLSGTLGEEIPSWEGISPQAIKRTLPIITYNPRLPMDVPIAKPTITRVIDSQTRQSKDYRVTASFQGQADKMYVTCSVVEVDIINAPKAPEIKDYN